MQLVCKVSFAGMKHWLAVTLFLLMAAGAQAQSPRRARPAVRSISSEGSIAVNFTAVSAGPPVAAAAAGQATVHAGAVSAAAGSRVPGVNVDRVAETLVVRTRIGVRVQGSAVSTADARLSAFLMRSDRGCRYRIDDQFLSEAPMLIDTRAPLGRVVEHVLEIEIPAWVPEGNLASSIGFIAAPN